MDCLKKAPPYHGGVVTDLPQLIDANLESSINVSTIMHSSCSNFVTGIQISQNLDVSDTVADNSSDQSPFAIGMFLTTSSVMWMKLMMIPTEILYKDLEACNTITANVWTSPSSNLEFGLSGISPETDLNCSFEDNYQPYNYETDCAYERFQNNFVPYKWSYFIAGPLCEKSLDNIDTKKRQVQALQVNKTPLVRSIINSKVLVLNTVITVNLVKKLLQKWTLKVWSSIMEMWIWPIYFIMWPLLSILWGVKGTGKIKMNNILISTSFQGMKTKDLLTLPVSSTIPLMIMT
jgi:hypothetical protein